MEFKTTIKADRENEKEKLRKIWRHTHKTGCPRPEGQGAGFATAAGFLQFFLGVQLKEIRPRFQADLGSPQISHYHGVLPGPES